MEKAAAPLRHALISATRLAEYGSSRVTRRGLARVTWHERACSEVANAYHSVGGEEWLPLELVALVMDTSGPHRKRIGVVYRDGTPWAVVPLRLAARYWEPLFVGVIPEVSPFPCRWDRGGVLAALRLNVATWACLESPAGFKDLRWSKAEPCYEVDLRNDPEPYWRETGLWRNIRQSRERCERFELVRDDPDGCDWMMRRWRDRFYTGKQSDVSSKWADRIAVARWSIENNWRMHSWHLRNGQRWISGFSAFVAGDRACMGTTYRDPDYNWFGVGHRLFYEALMWAQREGVATASLGADWEYKRRWAQGCGTYWNYVVAPPAVHLLNATRETAERRLRALKRN